MKVSEQRKEVHLGELIKNTLKRQSLSMRKFSSLCNIDVATISRIVNGKQQVKITQLKVFSEYLDVPLQTLLVASGYCVVSETKNNQAGILDSLESVKKLLKSSNLFDPEVTIQHIEQELVKYEQYEQTKEGRRMICQDFNTKVSQVNGVGPLIERLKEMHSRYCDKNTSEHDRPLLGSALLYFIAAADVIPDFLFPIGYLDDAIAVYLVLDRLEKTGDIA